MQKADFVTRLLAMLIDGLILGVANAILVQGLGRLFLGWLWWIIWVVAFFGYYVYFWTKSGQTIGKQVMKIKVVTTDGKLLDYTKAIIRVVGYWVSGAVLAIGFLWVLWDPEQQGWHDKIAGTYVIKA